MKNLANRSIKKVIKKVASKLGLICFEQIDFYSLDKYLDYHEFCYILMLYQAYRKIETVPGHIVELGVARGRNAILFGNMIRSHNDSSRRYYGFDTFSGYTNEDLQYNKNLDPCSWKISSEFVVNRINNAGYGNLCKIVKGDIKDTVPNFIKEFPDIKIAMIYIDCNAYLPAITALAALQKNMMIGAIICIDEKQDGGETRAILEFAKEHNMEIVKDGGPYSLPAYIKYTKSR